MKGITDLIFMTGLPHFCIGGVENSLCNMV